MVWRNTYPDQQGSLANVLDVNLASLKMIAKLTPRVLQRRRVSAVLDCIESAIPWRCE